MVKKVAIKHTIIVWISKANPIAKGWFSCVNIIEKIIKIEVIDVTIGISENSLKIKY